MAVDVRVPGVGESVQEGMIESWHKASGDTVAVDDILLELETDKATVEIAAEAAGVLEILVEAGSVVKVGQTIGRIADASAASPGRAPSAPTPPPVKQASPKSAAAEQPQPKSSTKSASSKPLAAERAESGPAVRRLVTEHAIDPAQVAGSGRGGRLTKGDVLEHMASRPAEAPSKKASSEPSPESAPVLSPRLEEGRTETRKPMSMLRRRIAQRLIEAQRTAAILTTFNEVDMSEVMKLRDKYKEAFNEKYGVKLGFMGFFLKASVAALESFPSVNAYIDGNDIVYHNYCDIGVAVSTPKGLVVPIVRNVDKLSLADMELAIAQYAKKAREQKIALDDLSGGTFTVSNGGVFGSLLSTPILNPPQSGILGMHKTSMRPMVMPDGRIEARPMMYLALSYDHRIIDGKEAVSFLVKIKDVLEDPSRLILGV